MSVYKVFAAGTGGTEDGAAQLDIQFDGEIQALFGSVIGDLDTDTDKVKAELSFISTNSLTNNDTRGSLITISEFASIGAAGAVVTQANAGVSGISIPVAAGERVWLHIVASANVDSEVTMYIYVKDGAGPELRRRR